MELQKIGAPPMAKSIWLHALQTSTSKFGALRAKCTWPFSISWTSLGGPRAKSF